MSLLIAANDMLTTAAALDDSFAAMFLVGHHAKAVDRLGICAHTISYETYKAVRIDGHPVSEGEIFASIAAQQGVPTALIAGDDIAHEVQALLVPRDGEGGRRAPLECQPGVQGGRITPQPARIARHRAALASSGRRPSGGQCASASNDWIRVTPSTRSLSPRA